MISIIVPVYKVEKYLSRCVESLISQTYSEIEIILVDDGSPDKSGEMCDKFALHDKRVVVIHKPNGGLSDARNRGLDIAKGDYVMFVDSDDWLEPNTCELLLNLANDNKADIVAFAINEVYDSGKIVKSPNKFSGLIEKDVCMEYLIHNVTKGGIYNYACNKMFLRSLFDDIRFPIGRLAEDQYVTYNLVHKARRIFVSDAPLYNYYQRPDSITSSQYYPKLIKDRHEMWQNRLEFLIDNYPNLVDYQVAELLGTAYVGIVKLNNKECPGLIEELNTFIKSYSNNIIKYVSLDRRIKLHYYCKPLFWLYVKLFVK